MNRIAVARIAWKEWRVQREFVLAILLMGVAAQWVLRAPLRIGWSEHATFTLGAALVATVFYALGCGAILFALERERETDGFLQALPISGMDTMWGKLAFAAISTLVVGLVLVSPAIPEALLIPGARLSPPAVFGHASYSGALGAGLLLIECFAWTVLFSIRTRTVMTAFLLSLAAIGLLDFVAAPALVYALPSILSGPDAMTVMEQWIRAGVIAVVLAAVVLRVRGEDRVGLDLHKIVVITIRMPRAARAARTAPAHRRRWGELRRMVWQHGKSASPWLAATLVCSLLLLGYWVAGIRPMSRTHAGRFDVHFVFLCIVLIPPAVFGVLAFHGDQLRRSFRFAAEQGIRPGVLWRSRHVIPGLCAIGWMLLIWVTGLALLQGDPALTGPESELPALPRLLVLFAGYLSLSTITCYAAGQFYSQMIRSGVLAVLCALVSAGVLAAWTALMAFSYVPVWWSVLPIPLLLFWVTYRRTLPWMTERLSGTERVRTAAWLTIPILLMLCGIAAHRAFELPPVRPAALSPGFPAAPTPEALETGRLYERALAIMNAHYPNLPVQRSSSRLNYIYTTVEYPLHPADPEEARANAEAMDLVERAGLRPDCSFPASMFREPPGPGLGPHGRMRSLAELILHDADAALARGDFDRAWRRGASVLQWAAHLARIHQGTQARTIGLHLQDAGLSQLSRWAAHPDQSMAQMDRAIQELDRLTGGMPSPGDVHGYAFAAALQQTGVANATNPVGGRGSMFGPVVTGITAQWMPWEVERLRRSHARRFPRQLDFWREVERQVQGWPEASAGQGYVADVFGLAESYGPFWRKDLLQRLLIDDSRPDHIRSRMATRAITELDLVTHRRAIRLALEMHRWRVEHGSLPDTLEALARPEDVPLSAVRGIPILFVPRGMNSLPKLYAHLVPKKYTDAMATGNLRPHLLVFINHLGRGIPLDYVPSADQRPRNPEQ